MKIQIKELTFNEENELEAFLLNSENTLLYTSIKFTRFLSYYLKSTLYYLIAVNEKFEILGCFPIIISNQSTYGKIANSLPFYGSNGGIILNQNLDIKTKEAVLSALSTSADKIISENQCAASTLITNPLDEQVNEWVRLNWRYDFTDSRIGQITLLPLKSENISDDLMKQFDDPRPRNIRKAIKSGVTCRSSNSADDIDFLFKTHHTNISGIGGLPKDELFFTQINKFFNEHDFKIYIAEYEGKKIAGLLLFYYNKTVEYYTPAVVEEFRQLQPTSLLICQAMIDAVQRGYKYWNWGGTWESQTGVYDFKKKWAASNFRYYYYIKLFNKEILHLSKEILLKDYPHFFILPFDKLSSDAKK